ncbi:hypothetical protein GPECTOR_50g609 [Gonium pectorale]|uniref:Uncharacterized protein n=1 Tax=Gonium pectorale TaxID=33097 RepID=A0A150G8C7_GONPE|nr:hypothetical protein GPECTOR_50g609 [Gonium pectorale]|eukprot:KXZ45815.1 hypothetical protein GPECTOR_50g609 [Gonium pectorale]
MRALGMTKPMHPAFGPLIYVISLMLKEAFTSFPNTVLFLMRAFLTDFNFSVFNGATDAPEGYIVMGKVLLVAWSLVATVCLSALLIAIVTFKYQPDKIMPESAYQQAVFVEHWQGMVTANWTGAPVSLIQVHAHVW